MNKLLAIALGILATFPVFAENLTFVAQTNWGAKLYVDQGSLRRNGETVVLHTSARRAHSYRSGHLRFDRLDSDIYVDCRAYRYSVGDQAFYLAGRRIKLEPSEPENWITPKADASIRFISLACSAAT